MTVVTLFTGKDGVLKNCKVNGHACFSKKGSDIVCAAVTILSRTALQVLSQTKDVTVKADTSSRGSLAFCVEVKNDSGLASDIVARLKCTADFLREGFSSLEREFPKNVSFSEVVQ